MAVKERTAEGAWRQVWSERLRRFRRSGLTVAAFCEQERVSVPSFYQWRRKLAGGSGGGVSRAQRKNARPRHSLAFVPLQITHSTAVEIRLPNGVQVWLPAGDAGMLAAGIAAAGSLAGSGTESEAC